MTTLIAEDLLLLFLDDDSGATNTVVPIPTVLGGAILIELAVAGAVEVPERTSVWKTAKVRPVPGARVEDPLLVEALATVAEKERTAQDLVGKLGRGTRERLAARLVERGILEHRKDRVLGLFPRTRWPVVDSRHEDEVRRALTDVLVLDAEPDPRTGALVALLAATDRAHKVVDRGNRSAREVRKRAKTISEGAWAAKAVRDALSASTAAITAATTTAAVAGTSGS
ncbi:GOLPH3/VPS74 family protein [Nocardioides pantholopis]|uniref:GOLPH3/VPS74 family protein n=1 Tax=Nocardioides pantholopis TaxID=2483798 RepID=UPI000FD7B778|nr:GPP34 family phosphoprotein [Nocardioides pantholopis]